MRRLDGRLRWQASSYTGRGTHRPIFRPAGRPPSDFDFDLDLSAPLTTMAERRH